MIKMVVIDGNAISRNLLTTLLINGGYDVIGDGNTSSASLAAMARLKPQVVCIDLGPMADGGMQLLDDLRAALPKALYFLVSANMDADTVQAALARGVNGFIVKPFKGDTVLSTIRNAILKVARQYREGKSD